MPPRPNMKILKMSTNGTDAMRPRFTIRTAKLLFSVTNLVLSTRGSTIKSFPTINTRIIFRHSEYGLILRLIDPSVGKSVGRPLYNIVDHFWRSLANSLISFPFGTCQSGVIDTGRLNRSQNTMYRYYSPRIAIRRACRRIGLTAAKNCLGFS